MLFIRFLVFLALPLFFLAMHWPGNTPSLQRQNGSAQNSCITQWPAAAEGMCADERQNADEMAQDKLEDGTGMDPMAMLEEQRTAEHEVAQTLMELHMQKDENGTDEAATAEQNGGREEGREKGREEGREKGREEGREKRREEGREGGGRETRGKGRGERGGGGDGRNDEMQRESDDDERDMADEAVQNTNLPAKKRRMKSMQEISKQKSFQERNDIERKTPKRQATKKAAEISGEAKGQGKDKASSSRGAKWGPNRSGRGKKAVLRGNSKTNGGDEAGPSEGQKQTHQSEENEAPWIPHCYQTPLDQFVLNLIDQGEKEAKDKRQNKANGQTVGSASTASSTDTDGRREKRRQRKEELDALAGKMGNIRMASSSSLSGANTPTVNVSSKTVHEREPKTKAEIGKCVVRAASESVKAIELNSVEFGFFMYDIFMPMLTDNRDKLAQQIIDRDTKNGSEETTVTAFIGHLRKEKKRVIDEILDEISEEQTIFDANMKLDEINGHGKVPDMHSKRPLLLFTYVRLYRKLGNALRWTLLTNDSEPNEQNMMTKQRRGILLNWSDKLVDKLMHGLAQKAEQNIFESAAQWVQNLCQMEETVELANFGILFILPHETWHFFGAERPTTVMDLFEKIGRAKIFEQIDDSFCDINSIEKMVNKKLQMMEPLNNISVFDKMKGIANGMVAQVKHYLDNTMKIKNQPSKIIFFNKVLHLIHTKLTSQDFSKIYVTKSLKVKPKLAEEKDNGLAFLEKCSEILEDKLRKYQEDIQRELSGVSMITIRKGPLEGGKTAAKSDGREGTSNDPIGIDCDDE